jgi:hypothetical protein
VLDFTLVHSTEFALRGGSGRTLVAIGHDSARLYGRAEQLRILARMKREKREIPTNIHLLKGEPPCIA